MDVLLFAVSGSLGAYLPKSDTLESSRSVKVALGLSLGLLSLSILEAAPSQWMVLLDHEDTALNRHGALTVTGSYRLILWIVCLWIIVVLPGLVGGRVFQDVLKMKTRRRIDGDDKKYSRWSLPWWVRYICQFILAVFRLVHRLMVAPCFRCIRRRLCPPEQPLLVLTNSHDGGSRHGGSRHGGSRHGPKSPSNQGTTSKTFVLGSVCGVLCSVCVLRTLGPLVIQVQAEKTQALPTLVSWLCATGLIVSSILNGFGCVSMPYTCLQGWSLESVRPEAIAIAEREYQETSKTLENKTADLLNDSAFPTTTARRSSSGVFPNKKSSFSSYSEGAQLRKQSLQKEINFLDMLLGEMKVDISEMKHSYEAAVQARTPIGQIRTYVGFVFSIVLLVRLYAAIMSTVHGDVSAAKRSDPITAAVLWLTGHNYVNQQDYNKVSQGISLVLTAVLSVSQVRTFLRTVSLVNGRLALLYRRFNCASSPSRTSELYSSYEKIYTCILAALMGCYFVSCVVLTKMSLPIEYRSGFVAALGGMDFTIKSSVVNLVFALSTAVSASILGILLGIQRQNTKRYAQETMTKLPPC